MSRPESPPSLRRLTADLVRDTARFALALAAILACLAVVARLAGLPVEPVSLLGALVTAVLLHAAWAGRPAKGRPRSPDNNLPDEAVGGPQIVRLSGDQARSVIESASEGIILIRPGCCIELVNARIEIMFGYRRDELIGQSIELLVPNRFREHHAALCMGYFRQPEVRPMGAGRELLARRKDGTEFPAEISLSFFQASDGVHTVSFITDITRRQHAEREVQRHSEKLEALVQERTEELRQAQAQILSQQRLQHDLELAQQVQASLLPRHLPRLPGYEFAAVALPARYVGGDVYDFALPDADTCFIVLADIAGKGVPAALLTSTARTLIRAEAEHERSPASILANVNRSLFDDLSHAEMFITMLVGRLDARLGRLTLANAGQMELLHWYHATRQCGSVPATGVPLGIYPQLEVGELTVGLRPGDALLLYSDGLTEASDMDNSFFGMERLELIVCEHARRPAIEIVQALVDAVESFRAEAPRSDDLSLIVIKCLPRTLTFTYPASLDHLDEITALVRQAVEPYGPDPAYQLELAVCELATNIIRHAYRERPGELSGEISLQPDAIQIVLYDHGLPFDVEQLPPVDLEEPHEGGYGLHIARQLTDELVYEPATPEGNRWCLVRRFGRPRSDTD